MHTPVGSLLRAASHSAAQVLLSGMEPSPTALYFAKEQCRLSMQAQQEDEEVKQAAVQAPQKVGTSADELTITLSRDLIGKRAIVCSIPTLLTYLLVRLI